MDEVVVNENGDEHLIDNNFIEEEINISYYSEADKISSILHVLETERTLRRWKAKLTTNIQRDVTEGKTVSDKAFLGDLLAKVESRTKENISSTEENQLNALRLHYSDLLNGKWKVETFLRIVRYTFQNRDPSMARVIHGWVKLSAQTGSLPPPGERGKHKKRQSALADKDLKRKCIEYFRSMPINE
ncbi:hypothetical protein V1504DRAFT_436916 [Lipomyces starkeyi]